MWKMPVMQLQQQQKGLPINPFYVGLLGVLVSVNIASLSPTSPGFGWLAVCDDGVSDAIVDHPGECIADPTATLISRSCISVQGLRIIATDTIACTNR